MHHTVDPIALVGFSSGPCELAFSMHPVILPLSVVHRFIGECHDALSTFVSIAVEAFVAGAVSPVFGAKSLLLVVGPFAFLIRFRIEVSKSAIPCTNSLVHMTQIPISIRTDVSTQAVGFIIGPFPFIN